ncbi:hypothetical protein Tco_0857809, partial [Tanacetum coccineum]
MSVKYPTYVNLTSSSKEQPNERTPSPPSQQPPTRRNPIPLTYQQAPSKSILTRTTSVEQSVNF